MGYSLTGFVSAFQTFWVYFDGSAHARGEALFSMVISANEYFNRTHPNALFSTYMICSFQTIIKVYHAYMVRDNRAMVGLTSIYDIPFKKEKNIIAFSHLFYFIDLRICLHYVNEYDVDFIVIEFER